MQSQLADKILNLVSKPRPASLRKISDETRVPYEWLKAFAYGKIDPCRANVAYLEALYVYFTGKSLQL